MADDFKNSLKLTRLSLLLSGIRIYPSEGTFWTSTTDLLFYFNLVWLYTDVFGEFSWLFEGIQAGKSFGELSFIAPCATICLLATAKSGPVYYYRHTVLEVCQKLKDMHPKFDETPQETERANDKEYGEDKKSDVNSKEIEKEIVKESIKILNFVIRLLFYSSASVVMVFTLLPVVSMIYDYYKKGETDLKFPFLIKYFFDPFTKTRWPFVYIHQVWSTYIAGFNVFGTDTYLYAFCTYTHMHFRILCHRYEHIVSNSLTETKKNLMALVKRHQELIELVDQIEVVFSKSILFNIITSSVLICLSGFNITVLDDVGAVFAFFTFLVMSLSQISLLCLFGDMLMRSSTKVSEAIYKCRWYDTDIGTKKIVFLILIRAQKPCKLTAAKFADLNLTAFTTILSRSWSYFALLRTMYK